MLIESWAITWDVVGLLIQITIQPFDLFYDHTPLPNFMHDITP